MKHLKKLERKHALSFFKSEKNKIILKYFIINSYYQHKKGVFIYPKYLLCFANVMKYSITKIKPRCYFSNKGNGILKDFKLSRMCFKENASYGYLFGLRKSSW